MTDDEQIRDEHFTTLRDIVGELDKKDWSPDTLERIADHLRCAGFEIRDVEPGGVVEERAPRPARGAVRNAGYRVTRDERRRR